MGGLGVLDCISAEVKIVESMVGGLGVDSEFINGELEGEGRPGTVLPSRRRSFVSSKSLSCKRWLLARFAIRWKGNGGSKRRSFSRRTREQATNVNPAENSFFPTSITTLSKVRP